MSDHDEFAMPSLSRRQVLLGASAIAALAAGSALAEDAPHDQHHEHHHAHGEHAALVEAAMKCQAAGQTCLSHCLLEFSRNNGKMAACASAVQEMLPMCHAISVLASLNSAHLKKVAAACIDICDKCAAECDKHASEHDTCRACRDACKDCIKEMQKV